MNVYSGFNMSLYNGSVNYIFIDEFDEDYWRIFFEVMVIQGNFVFIVFFFGGSNFFCVIDIGIIFIGVFFQIVYNIYF